MTKYCYPSLYTHNDSYHKTPYFPNQMSLSSTSYTVEHALLSVQIPHNHLSLPHILIIHFLFYTLPPPHNDKIKLRRNGSTLITPLSLFSYPYEPIDSLHTLPHLIYFLLQHFLLHYDFDPSLPSNITNSSNWVLQIQTITRPNNPMTLSWEFISCYYYSFELFWKRKRVWKRVRSELERIHFIQLIHSI